VIVGAIERFLGVFGLKHYAGAFLSGWLPVQAMIVTVTDAQLDFPLSRFAGNSVIEAFALRSTREVKSLAIKFREAQTQKGSVHARYWRQGN